MGNIVQPLMFIAKAIAASGNFFAMIDADRVQADGLMGKEASVNGDIEFRDVHFSYPTRPGVKILNGFNAVFQAGKTTALVGPSGSGKSTIVALLERWYELHEEDVKIVETARKGLPGAERPELVGEKIQPACSGSIITTGHETKTFNLKWWRSQIGLVQQEPFLFNDTIEKNVAYGLTGTQWENVSDAEKLELIKEACKEAYADDFITKLPRVRAQDRKLLLTLTSR